MQDNKNNKTKKHGKTEDTMSDYRTFPHVGGKKDPKSGVTIPSEASVDALKSFVEENKK